MPFMALVVDDSMLIRHTVCRFLEQRGFAVESASDGREALAILRKVQPDIIITDMQMPNMSGGELISELKSRAQTAKIPIVIVAGRRSGFEDILAHTDAETRHLVASFQRAVVEDLVGKTLDAARAYDVATLLVTGGVAANNELRQTFEGEAAEQGLQVFFPSRPLSTDNAAMIAAAAFPRFQAGDFAAMDFSAEAGLRLR